MVRFALSNIVLKGIDTGKASFFEGLHFVIDTALFAAKRLQLPVPVMNDPDRRAEA